MWVYTQVNLDSKSREAKNALVAPISSYLFYTITAITVPVTQCCAYGGEGRSSCSARISRGWMLNLLWGKEQEVVEVLCSQCWVTLGACTDEDRGYHSCFPKDAGCPMSVASGHLCPLHPPTVSSQAWRHQNHRGILREFIFNEGILGLTCFDLHPWLWEQSQPREHMDSITVCL